jgi:hypothetical protein
VQAAAARNRGKVRGAATQIQEDLNNHSNQLKPNNNAYWQSRGETRARMTGGNGRRLSIRDPTVEP